MCKFTSTTHQRATCFVSVYRHAVLCELSLLFAGLRGGPDPISQSRRVFVGNSSFCGAKLHAASALRAGLQCAMDLDFALAYFPIKVRITYVQGGTACSNGRVR